MPQLGLAIIDLMMEATVPMQALINKEAARSGWDASTTASWADIITSETGCRSGCRGHNRSGSTRPNPNQICAQISLDYTIVHCENVLRKGLAQKFRATRQELLQALNELSVSQLERCLPAELRHNRAGKERKREEAVDYLTRAHLTFHGTLRHTSHPSSATDS